MYVCVRRNFGSFLFGATGRAYGDAVMRVRHLAARGKQARARRDVPDDIREHLPEELSDLPADLVFAANHLGHRWSLSAPLRQIAQSIKWTDARFRAPYVLNPYIQSPQWAVDTISSLTLD